MTKDLGERFARLPLGAETGVPFLSPPPAFIAAGIDHHGPGLAAPSDVAPHDTPPRCEAAAAIQGLPSDRSEARTHCYLPEGSVQVPAVQGPTVLAAHDEVVVGVAPAHSERCAC